MMKLPRPAAAQSRGSMILAILFVVFLSLAGMALLTHTLVHQHILSARAKKIAETERIYQELIFYQHQFREKVFGDNLLNIHCPESDYFNLDIFPDVQVNQVLIKNSFSNRIQQQDDYRKIRIIDTIQILSLKSRYQLKTNVIIDLLSGNIPLHLITFFLQAKIEIPEDIYLKENHIEVKAKGQYLIGDIPVDFDVTGFLADALKIQGNQLSWAEIRKKFGFDISDEPIEKGIYILAEEGRVETIFIQGDLQKLIFSTREGIQEIQFHLGGQCYQLSYQPQQNYFRCWDPQIPVQSVFNQKIIVNGNLWSLEQSQQSAFLESTNIKLLVSGQTVITTSLETQNLDIEKIRLNNLTLIGGTHDLFLPENSQPGVTVDIEGKAIIQATILVQGRFENRSEELEISGSLFAEEVHNQGRLTIHSTDSGFDSGTYFHTGIITIIIDFFIDFIEEVYDV